MQTDSFNLVQTTAVLQKRWKTLLLFVLVSGIAATITVCIVPPYFRAAATVVPANPALADKGRLFNANIQMLYSYFGTGDDLDRIYGIADMRSTYTKLVDEFSLVDYYQLKGNDPAILKTKAAKCLQKNIDLKKTEQNQLQIIAWMKDSRLAANIVNRMVAIIETTAADVWQKNYRQSISGFEQSIAVKEKAYQALVDSMPPLRMGTQAVAAVRMGTLSEEIRQYRKTAEEFKMAAETAPPVLYVLEPALPAAFAERPDKLVIILSACLAAFIFSSLLVLVNDRKSMA